MKRVLDEGWPLICSVCEDPLRTLSGVMRCSRGHSFDIARGGYVNLLNVKHAERGIQGDTRAMLHARRRFLDSGHYKPLLETLCTHVNAALTRRGAARPEPTCVLEVGCGEGYYIGNVAAASPGKDSIVRYVGMDVAKDAARLAAGKYKSARFAVANARRRLYVATESVGALLSIFAPRNEPEFRRVLAPEGALIVAIPGPRHMASVRRDYGLLNVEDAKDERIHNQFTEHFSPVDRHLVEYPVVLTPEHVRDFIMMGPSAYHVNAEELEIRQSTETMASFEILTFHRRG